MKDILFILFLLPVFAFAQKGAGTITGGSSGGSSGGSTIDSLTVNYVVKASTDTTIENSQIFDNGTSVGIGTATPAAKLSIKNLQEPTRATVVTTQTFDSATDWTTGTNWSISAGVATATGASADLTYIGSLTVTSGVLYEVTYTMSGYSAGTFTMKIGGATYLLPSHNATNNVIPLLPVTTSGGFRITASGGTANFDNIFLIEGGLHE